jgi:DNA-binding transcriptional LysR family regulator
MAEYEWDDLRYVLAVATAGSLASAARTLGVNHTTVLRRVTAFEEHIGVRVFDRLPTGYVLTPAGEELAAAARGIDDTINALTRKLAGHDLTLTGELRVTSTDTLMEAFLPRILADFKAAQPGIRIDLSVSNVMLNLSRRDADVAIRPTIDPPETLVGRRISKIAFAIYASKEYLRERGQVDDLAQEQWVALDDSLSNTSVAKWMRTQLPDADVTFRTDSLVAMRQAARAGLGLAALPCYLGDASHDLIRVHPPIPAMETALWVLTHEDLRHTPRVRAFTDFMAEALRKYRPMLEGENIPSTWSDA